MVASKSNRLRICYVHLNNYKCQQEGSTPTSAASGYTPHNQWGVSRYLGEPRCRGRPPYQGIPRCRGRHRYRDRRNPPRGRIPEIDPGARPTARCRKLIPESARRQTTGRNFSPRRPPRGFFNKPTRSKLIGSQKTSPLRNECDGHTKRPAQQNVCNRTKTKSTVDD